MIPGKLALSIVKFDTKEAIVECEECGELQPADYVEEVNGKKICMMCKGDRYFSDSF